MTDSSFGKEDLIIEMLLTLCGRNLEISFSETSDFKRKWDKLKSDKKETCKILVTKHKKYAMLDGEIRCQTCGILWSKLGLD